MKKIRVCFFIYLIINLVTSGYLYPYTETSIRTNYLNGTIHFCNDQNATLLVEDDSIVIDCGKDMIEIPFDSIIQLSWSEKKKKLNFDYSSDSRILSSNKIFDPFNSYQPAGYSFPRTPKLDTSDYILLAIPFVLAIIGIIKNRVMTRTAYQNVL